MGLIQEPNLGMELKLFYKLAYAWPLPLLTLSLLRMLALLLVYIDLGLGLDLEYFRICALELERVY